MDMRGGGCVIASSFQCVCVEANDQRISCMKGAITYVFVTNIGRAEDEVVR